MSDTHTQRETLYTLYTVHKHTHTHTPGAQLAQSNPEYLHKAGDFIRDTHVNVQEATSGARARYRLEWVLVCTSNKWKWLWDAFADTTKNRLLVADSQRSAQHTSSTTTTTTVSPSHAEPVTGHNCQPLSLVTDFSMAKTVPQESLHSRKQTTVQRCRYSDEYLLHWLTESINANPCSILNYFFHYMPQHTIFESLLPLHNTL